MNVTFHRRVVTAAVLAGAWCASAAVAKRTVDYVPPPYMDRFLYSVFGVAPFAAVLTLVCAVAMIGFGTSRSLRRFFLLSAVLTIAGCLLAAADGLNDELWEPWLGASLFVAFIPSAALYLGHPRREPWLLIPAGGLAVPIWFVLVLAGIPWQAWAFNHGFPVSW